MKIIRLLYDEGKHSEDLYFKKLWADKPGLHPNANFAKEWTLFYDIIKILEPRNARNSRDNWFIPFTGRSV